MQLHHTSIPADDLKQPVNTSRLKMFEIPCGQIQVDLGPC